MTHSPASTPLNHSTPPLRVESVPILVLLHPDGFVEVYGHRNVDVHIATLVAMQSAQGQILAEEYLELNMPPRHRAIYAPGMIRAAKMNRIITPSDLADVRDDLAILRTADSLQAINRKEGTQWTL